jgi:hypothetical protein
MSRVADATQNTKASVEAVTPPQESAPLTGVWQYILHARPAVALTVPLIYACVVPFVILDLSMSVYQIVCFPIYGIPSVKHADYIVFDRGRLRYLNVLQRLNCLYCSYANGVVAYAGEIAARTEQYWCPIKHHQLPRIPHSRYAKFLPYGDEPAYRDYIEEVRNDFKDLR